jgi:class 3 adenylate cyclase/tetratricopeptide (TPR) repeat protein
VGAVLPQGPSAAPLAADELRGYAVRAMVVCLACAHENREGAKYCEECAAALAAPMPVREERRVVTVLFADLAGFTARSEALDPEDVRAFLVPYYDVLTGEIIRHGGVVERFLGDGVMALFGAPVAHEDDPERAVRAALAILEPVRALDLGLHVRIGINTGPVLFAAAGPGQDDVVTGDAVNTAARLQGAAPVDSVVVGEGTWQSTLRAITYASIPPFNAKGKSEPLAAWRAIAPIAQPQGPLVAETTPFVGRELERSFLISLFNRVRTTHSAEFVTIVADAGMGKSRLVRELARHVEAMPDLVTWRAGRCPAYGGGIGLWALGEIVKVHAGILDTDDQATLRFKIEAVLVEPDPSMRTWMVDRLAPLVGIETRTQPPAQEEAFTAWRRFLEQIAQAGPTVLVVEDLHWASETLVAFLSHLADNTAGVPLLVVVTGRPEVQDRHPSWLARKQRRTVLSLAALADGDIESLLAAILGDARPELRATILERASGSPLYAEQLGAMFRDRLVPITNEALNEDAIPASIAALLAARIDTLSGEAKSVLLDASVIGKTFWPGAVAVLSPGDPSALEAALSELTRREFVRPSHPSSIEGEDEYAFWHALLRDVGYGELTRGARLSRHRAAAAWLTERAGAALGENAAIVVAHLERALELASATGATAEMAPIRVRLVDALLAAADNAMRTEVPRAIGYLHRALELLDPDDRRRAHAFAVLGLAMNAAGRWRDAAGAFEAARHAYIDHGESVAAAEVAAPLAIALRWNGDATQAVRVLADARDVLELAPGPGLVAVIAGQSILAYVADRYEEAMALAGTSISMAAQLGIAPHYRALSIRGALRSPDEIREAEADLEAQREGAIDAGDFSAAAFAWIHLAWIRRRDVSFTAALEAHEQAIAFLRERGLPTQQARRGRLQLLFEIGRWDDVLAEVESLRPWYQAQGDGVGLWACDVQTAYVRLPRGERVGRLDEILVRAAALGLDPADASALVAEAAVAEDDLDAAVSILGQALESGFPSGIDMPAELVRACLRAGAPDLARRAMAKGVKEGAIREVYSLLARAMLDEAEGDLEAARREYATAAVALERHADVVEHAYALMGLGRCLLAVGETHDGVMRLRESREIWERLNAAARIAEIDALLSIGRSPR